MRSPLRPSFIGYFKWLLLFVCALYLKSYGNAQDWANLNKYKKANAELPEPNRKEERVVFMGDSIIESWLYKRPEFFQGKPYVNRGIGGQTTPQMLLRFKQDVLDLTPKVVVILAGINDIAGNTGPMTAEQIADNIKKMSDLAKANRIKVMLCSVLPANDFPWRPGLEPADKVIRVNEMIKAYALENEVTYVDFYSAMVNDEKGLKAGLGDDGVHPNEAGYAIMEPILEAALADLSKRR